jgi:hypothetical protein
MCGRARWLMEELSIGPTVAGQERYAISDSVVDVESLLVGSLPYTRTGAASVYKLKAGLASLQSAVGEGVFAPAFAADGVESVALYPAPATSGDAITALAAVLPTDLSGTQSPSIPEDIQPYLRDGCVADGLRLIDERLSEANDLEARYETGVALLIQRKHSRIGSGPSSFQVKGVHW